jgi:hypothetical protein
MAQDVVLEGMGQRDVSERSFQRDRSAVREERRAERGPDASMVQQQRFERRPTTHPTPRRDAYDTANVPRHGYKAHIAWNAIPAAQFGTFSCKY